MPNDHYLLPAFAEKYMEGVVISGGEIHSRMEKLAYDVLKYYNGKPFTMLSLLKGSSRIKE